MVESFVMVRIRRLLLFLLKLVTGLPVKAAGVLCVLGISFGIGTYVLYKIYNSFIRPKFGKKPSKSDKKKDPDETDEGFCSLGTDEGKMGNEHSISDIPVYYKPGYGVSIYRPAEKVPIIPTQGASLRNRRSGSQLSQVTNDVLRETQNFSEVENGNVPSKYSVELSVEVGDPVFQRIDSFDENDTEASPYSETLSNSLKGNFSPRSLYEKCYRYGSVNSATENDDSVPSPHSNNDTSDPSRNSRVESLNLVNSLGASSVLLTPPSEDESGSTDKHVFPGSSHASYHDTKSDVSEIQSEVASLPSDHRPVDVEHGEGGTHTDEDVDNFSPLPRDNSPYTTPEKHFKSKLKLKLNEISFRSRSDSNCSSPRSCTPDSYADAGQRRRSLDKQESLSGISSPELELLPSESTDSPMIVDTFENIEDEIHEVEDEFEMISTKLQELTSKCAETDDHAGLAIVDEILLRYPSIRIRQKSLNAMLSGGISGFSRNNSAASIGGNSDVTEPDLSWDLENVLELVYSDKSEDQSGVRLGTGSTDHVQQVAVESSLPNVGAGNQTFNSVVEMDGSLYEDDFQLDLGMSTSMVASSAEGKGDNPEGAMIVSFSLDGEEEDSHQSSANHSEDSPQSSANHSEDSPQSSANHSEDSPQSSANHSEDSPQSSANHSEDSPAQSQGDQSGPLSCAEDDKSQVCPSQQDSASQERPSSVSVCNIGEKHQISEYASREWRGDTPTANTMRQGYEEIPKRCECCHLRRIRGDNYCGIRGTLYQALLSKLPPCTMLSSVKQTLALLKQTFSDSSSGLQHWTFAKRVSCQSDNLLDVMSQCLQTLYAKFEEVRTYDTYSKREKFVLDLLNSDPDCDLHLMEGAKLLMLLCAVKLQHDMTQGNDVPIFAYLLFARESSENLPAFVRNHLNPVGDSSGLEQVEMFLLGHALGVRIQVFRLQQFGQEDFVSYYPDTCSDSWPTVSLIAEDDRHYNVPVH